MRLNILNEIILETSRYISKIIYAMFALKTSKCAIHRKTHRPSMGL
jgi:hypothetical protein